MKRSEKPFFVENLTEELSSAKSVVLINYTGLNVKNQQELKKRLKSVGGKMIVVKNTLLKRAGEAAKIDSQILTDKVLTGQTALIISSEDAIAPLQVLGKFQKEFEIPKMKVGIIEGKFADNTTLTKLASLPGKDALLGQLLGALLAPEYGLIGILQANIQELLFVLNSKVKS